MITAKRYDAITYRLLEGETIVGFALAMANGSWGYATSKAVAKEFEVINQPLRPEETGDAVRDDAEDNDDSIHRGSPWTK